MLLLLLYLSDSHVGCEVRIRPFIGSHRDLSEDERELLFVFSCSFRAVALRLVRLKGTNREMKTLQS